MAKGKIVMVIAQKEFTADQLQIMRRMITVLEFHGVSAEIVIQTKKKDTERLSTLTIKRA